MWDFEYDMNMEIYEYECIFPPTNGIGNFMKCGREMFFQQLSFYLFMEFYGQKLENDVP